MKYMDYRCLGSIFRGPLTGVTIGYCPTRGAKCSHFGSGDQGESVWGPLRPPEPFELSVIPARRTRSIVAETWYRPPGKRTLGTGGEVIFMPFVLYEKSRTEYTGVHESD